MSDSYGQFVNYDGLIGLLWDGSPSVSISCNRKQTQPGSLAQVIYGLILKMVKAMDQSEEI